MFIRAGFNKRFKTVCVAIVKIPGRWPMMPAYLVRFVPSGDMAWLNAYGIWWGESVLIMNRFEIPPYAEWLRASPLPA